MVENVKRNGVMDAITVRPKNGNPGQYEIISGLNRFEAAKTAGDSEICARVIECDDEIALYISFEYNIAHRPLNELKPSRFAKIMGDFYDAIKKQGRREDLVRRAIVGDIALERDFKKARTSGRFSQKSKGGALREAIAERYGLTGRNMARYLRINKLIDPLKERLDNGNICFTAAVDLSFLTKSRQLTVEEQLAAGAEINVKKSGRLHSIVVSKTRTLDVETIKRVLFGREKKQIQREVREINEEEIKEIKKTAELEKNQSSLTLANTLAAQPASDALSDGIKTIKLETAGKYKQIEDMAEYLKTKFPKLFEKKR
jgi:ParB family chromosome partitioning protein